MKGESLDFSRMIAGELSLNHSRVAEVIALMNEGATIPFIARYRKEVSGGMDEVTLTTLRDSWHSHEALHKRRTAVLASLEERELLTDRLREKLEKASTLTQIEDIYLPFRPKRRTRAVKAVEAGLEPLAQLILLQRDSDPEKLAEPFVSPEKGVEDAASALAGARDIIAEKIVQDASVRGPVRDLYMKRGVFVSKVIKGKETEGSRYRDWFDWSEKVATAPSHRVLAMRRGERELFLNLSVQVEEEDVLRHMKRKYPLKNNLCGEQILLAMTDGFKRLLGPQMETEIRLWSKERADREAISVFAVNLRELLMASPLGEKSVLAIDPGFRTGCKTVCLDRQGKLLEHTTIFPHTGRSEKAAEDVKRLIKRHKMECIAVGNGTAGRETESFLKKLDPGIPIIMVNESGASIYSASETARKEFPDLDLTVRGSVSIGRRLQDPLAELVKIDPESVGVGQYQHDVDKKLLKGSLDDTVISCVNSVGVNLNSASAELLTRVSGLSAAKAASVVTHRKKNGPFSRRKELLKVAGIGPSAFQQCAGFLRIPGAANPLDASAVHPESYVVVEKMAADAGTTITGLMDHPEQTKELDLQNYVTPERGLPTLRDILKELEKPGRDPRSVFEAFSFADVHTMEDLTEGMKVPGIVTNVTDFGAFVDIGVHTDGLVHVSKLSTEWIRHPSEVVHAGMKVNVTVESVDMARKRISLSMI